MKQFSYHAALVVLFFMANCLVPARADDTAAAKDELAALIKQLGDASFKVRESAAKQLLDRGLDARDALRSALDHSDLEIRLRADQLLVAIAQRDLNQRLSAFLDDTEGKQEHDLPAWKRFQELVGNDRDTRKYFAAMIRAETPLLQAYEAGASRATSALAQRIQSLQSETIPGFNQELPPPSLATLLFVGADPNVKIETSAGYQVFNVLNQPHAQTTFTTADGSPIARKLLIGFLQGQESNSLLARNGLLLTLRFKMDDVGLALARKIVQEKSDTTGTLPYALLTIGRLGGPEDRAAIEKFLANETVCHSWHNGQVKEPILIQVRDVALAVLVHLTKQDHKEYGFDLLRESTTTLFEVYTCGFVQNERREAAFAKWAAWSKQEKAG